MRRRRNHGARRLQISRGLLYGGYEPHDMPGAYIVLTYQVFELTGRPSTGNYDGPGFIVDLPGSVERELLLGSGAPHTSLEELRVSTAPTPEADEYDAGYRAGWKAKRKPAPSRSPNYTDGLRQGYADRQRA